MLASIKTEIAHAAGRGARRARPSCRSRPARGSRSSARPPRRRRPIAALRRRQRHRGRAERGGGRRGASIAVRRRRRRRDAVPRRPVRLGRREPGRLRLLRPHHVRLRAGRRLAAAPRRLAVRDGRRRSRATRSSPATSSSSTASATWASTSAAGSSSTRRTPATSSRSRASRTRGTRRPGSARGASSSACLRILCSDTPVGIRCTSIASLNRVAASATAHCLTGCAIGEVLGIVIATALGWGNAASIALAIRSRSSSVTR